MNESIVRAMPRLPLPRGSETEAWVIDLTKPELVGRTWTPETAPYTYTPAGAWVRKAMPWKGVMRAPRLIAALTDFAERMQGELHDEFAMPRGSTPRAIADVILAKALVEAGTPFASVQVEPTGRVWFHHELQTVPSWHPDAPRARA